jgi:chromosome partitioning protein
MDESAPAPRLIATASPKGGAGKTMTTILLACEFAAAGHRVLILDTDIQGSAAGWFNASKAARFPLKNIAVEQITAQDAIMARLQALLKNGEGYDVALIDVQGTATAALSTAVVYSDLVLIPTRMHKFDVDQAVALARYVSGLGGRGRATPYRIVVNAVNAIDRNSAAFKLAETMLAQARLDRLSTYLSLRPTFATVASAGSLYEVANPNKAVIDARNMTRDLMNEVACVLNELDEGAAA